jgi:hypothetical protein
MAGQSVVAHLEILGSHKQAGIQVAAATCSSAQAGQIFGTF